MQFSDVLCVLFYQGVIVSVFALAAFVLFFKFADGDIPSMIALWRSQGKKDLFKGRVVMITGASMGIGEELAYEVARRGGSVIVAARSLDKLKAVAAKCEQLGAPKAMALRLDQTDPHEAHKAAVEQVIAAFGRIDILVNNAGRSQRALAEETELAVDEELMKINHFGVVSVTKAVLPYFLQQGSGHIVNTSSVAGKSGSPLSASYAASKGALQLYFNALRAEVGSRGITVSNICPGPIGTGTITLNAATAKAGESYGQMQEDGVKKMTTERCVAYIVAAIDSKLDECWCALQPILFFVYVSQYLLGLYFFLSPIVGARRVAAFRGGDGSYGSIQSIPDIIRGWLTGKDKKAAAAAGPAPATATATVAVDDKPLAAALPAPPASGRKRQRAASSKTE